MFFVEVVLRSALAALTKGVFCPSVGANPAHAQLNR